MRSDKLIHRARDGRKEPTPSEAIVWRWLRDRRFCKEKFRRQHLIGGYIADFYCCELKLAIELNGRGHDYEQFYDVQRDLELSKRGVTVLRIRNELIRDEPTAAADWIVATIERLRKGDIPSPVPSLRSELPSPASGRGR